MRTGIWRGALLLAEPPTTVKISCYFPNVLILEITSHHFARAFGVRKEPALSEVERASSQRFGDWVALRRVSSKVERVVLNALAK
jgi:hypothetical protein